MNTTSAENPAELKELLHLKRTFLRAALAIASGSKSTPEATRVAGNEAASLKTEIIGIESKLEKAA